MTFRELVQISENDDWKSIIKKMNFGSNEKKLYDKAVKYAVKKYKNAIEDSLDVSIEEDSKKNTISYNVEINNTYDIKAVKDIVESTVINFEKIPQIKKLFKRDGNTITERMGQSLLGTINFKLIK